MTDKPQFFIDLEGTIPARDGDRVALAKNMDGRGTDMQSVSLLQRPLLKGGHLYFDGTADEITRLTARVAELEGQLGFADATVSRLNGSAALQDLMKINNGLVDRVAELEEGLSDLLSWVPEKPSPPEWRMTAGEYGADDAINRARALLTPAPEKKWPPGFFVIGRRIDLRCATENCGQTVSMRMEVGGVGSVYCEPCARKIADMTAPAKGGE